MPSTKFYRLVGVSAAALAAGSGLLAQAAVAAPAPTDLTIVGSNTTQELMGAVTTAFNQSSVATTNNIHATNVYAQPADPGTVAPSDKHCNGGTAITYIQEANPGPNQRTAPNGSSAGKAALSSSVEDGDSCTSIARSSSPGSSTDPAGTQAWAYAVDTVSWSAKSGGAAPTNLSMTQLEAVYDCSVTNWDQVGGKNAPIVRFYPQEGSGSGSFFAGVLGFDPRTLGGVNTCATAPTQIEENEATSIPASQAADAVMIYSAGGWIAQANGVDPDMRNGFTMRTINGTKNSVVAKNASTGKYVVGTITVQKNVEPATYQVGNNSVPQGVRDLFNFINTNSVDYTSANKMVGKPSALCNGKDASIVTTYGFRPLGTCILSS